MARTILLGAEGVHRLQLPVLMTKMTPQIYRGNGPLYMIIQTEDVPTSVPRRNLDKTGHQTHIL